MASIREQIILKIMEVLVDTPAGQNVYRSLTIPIKKNASPAIIVLSEKESQSPEMGSISTRTLSVAINVIARGEIADSQSDAALVDVHKKIMADTRLGGLALYIEEMGTDWDIEDADSDAVVATINYDIVYRTALKDYEVAG